MPEKGEDHDLQLPLIKGMQKKELSIIQASGK